MYVAYGWPRTLNVKADSVQEDVVHLSLSDDYLVVVSTVSVQIWSGDQATPCSAGMSSSSYTATGRTLLLEGTGWGKAGMISKVQ